MGALGSITFADILDQTKRGLTQDQEDTMKKIAIIFVLAALFFAAYVQAQPGWGGGGRGDLG